MNEQPNDTINLTTNTSASSVSSTSQQFNASSVASTIGDANPDDVFAAFHFTYFPRFKMLTQNLGKTRLLKLLWAIGDVPDAVKMDKLFTKEQKEAYLILDKLLLAKFSLVFGEMYKNLENEQLKQNNSEGEETSSFPTKND